MVSKQFTRKPLAEHLTLTGKELTASIRQLKQLGKIVQRRVYVDPVHSDKRQTVFNFVAVNMELPLS